MWYSNMSEARHGLISVSALVSLLSTGYLFIFTERQEIPARIPDPKIHVEPRSVLESAINDLKYYASLLYFSGRVGNAAAKDYDWEGNRQRSYDGIMLGIKDLPLSQEEKDRISKLITSAFIEYKSDIAVAEIKKLLDALPIAKNDTEVNKPKSDPPTLWSQVKTEASFWTPLMVSIMGAMTSIGTLILQHRQHRFNVQKENGQQPKPKQQPGGKRRRAAA